MKHVRTISGPRWAAGLIIAMAVSAYGCGDSASVSENVEVPLSSLAVSPGTLRPAFSPNTTSYQFNAPTAASSVTVTAAPQNSTTTMTINGNQTAAEQVRSIPLGPPGSTIPIPITLTSQTGGESTYTVTITRLLSSDNNLKTLTVTQGTLSPAFTSDQLTYTVDVATNVTSVTLTATKSDPEAVISDGLNNDGRAEILLGGPGTNKTVSITVTAPNGSSQTYTVTINRAASGNNNLSALRVEAETVRQTLSPPFSSRETGYTVNVGTKVTAITVDATKADPNAVISGSLPNEGQATIQLNGPGNPTPVSITVTAQNGISKTYTITVNRAAPSSNNDLSTLSVTSGTLRPTFTAEELTYTVDVPTSTTSIDVSATKADPDAVISGDLPNEGRTTFPLGGAGTSKVVSITVTAPNGNSKTYRITINRLASNDSSLSALNVSAGTLEPGFDSGTVNYTLQVGILVGSVTITTTKSDPNAVMSALGSVIAAAGSQTGQVTVSPGLGLNPPINILVTAQDGVASTTYSITITRSF
ncbi:MAG: hypothetical protein CV090_08685 [Nitrospira sp. WS238]|nr:hypothetical protein [Nitrospira sp. WS238]